MALQDLRIGHRDTAHHAAFLRWVPRVFPRADFRAWYARGGWTPPYVAYATAEGGELVANVSAMRARLVVEGREVRGAQLGAVGCVPGLRGRGLVRRLLERALAELDAEAELVFLYANDTVLDLYPRFGFRRARESIFELEHPAAPGPTPAPRVDLDHPGQRDTWLATCARALSPTERFGARDYGSAALWHACNAHPDAVRALAEGETYAVAVQEGDTLHLLDVAATDRFDVRSAVPRLVGSPIARIRFGFCPERWCPEARVVGPSDDLLFVRGSQALPAAPFRLPVLAQT